MVTHSITLINEYVARGFDQGSRKATQLASSQDKLSRSLSNQQQKLLKNHAAIRQLQSLQSKGIVLTTGQKKHLDNLTQGYKTMGGQMSMTGRKTEDLLVKFTKMRWALVNVALAAGLVAGAFKLIQNSAGKIESSLISLEVASRNSGESFEDILKTIDQLQAGFGGMISKASLMQGAMIFLKTGIPIDQFEKWTRTVADGAAAMGEDFNEQLIKVTRGLVRLEPRLLDNIGIELKLNQVYAKASKELGKNQAALTTQERIQAMYNAAIERGTINTGAFNAQQDTLNGKFNTLKVSLEEFGVVIGEAGLLGDLKGIVDATTNFVESFNKMDKDTLSSLINLGETGLFALLASAAGSKVLAMLPAIGAGLAGIAAFFFAGPLGGLGVAVAALALLGEEITGINVLEAIFPPDNETPKKALGDIENVTEAIEELKETTVDYQSILSGLNSELRGIGNQLGTVKDKIKATNQQINNILSRRFNIRGISETQISHLINQQELELNKARFATMGLGSAEDFLRSASVLTTDSINSQSTAIKKLINVTSEGQDRFDAWRMALSATIQELMFSSQSIDRDVTEVIRKAQTELLSITRFDSEKGNQFEAMENNVNVLKDAQGIFFGEEQEQLEFSEKLRDDRINGMNENAEMAISLLESERSALQLLLKEQERQIRLQQQLREEIIRTREASAVSAGQKTAATQAAADGRIGPRLESGAFLSSDPYAEGPIYAPSTVQKKILAASRKQNDFVMRPGQAPVPFSSEDIIMGVKDPTQLMGGKKEININIQGYNRNPNELAIEVRRQLSSLA